MCSAILLNALRFMRTLFGIILFFPLVVFGQATKEFVIHSKELKTDRKIWVNVPEYYELNKDSLQLIFLLDGNNKSLFDYTVASKRFLESNSADLSEYKAPKSIIVGIEQAENRWNDFGDSSNSPKFLSFLETEVIPFVNSNYRTVHYKILIGHSLGGRFAITTFLSHPDLFNAVIAASPAIPSKMIGTILSRFDTLFKSKLPYDKAFYFSTTYLKGDGTEEGFRKFSEALEEYLKNRTGTNFRFAFNSSATLGHAKSPFFSIPEGLHFIYSPSLWQLSADSLFNKNSSAVSAVNNYVKRIENKFGIQISVHPYAAILADELLKTGKTNDAIELLKSEVGREPTDINLFAFLLTVMKKNKVPDYKVYQTKLLEVFKQVGMTQKEQSEWIDSIEKNSR